MKTNPVRFHTSAALLISAFFGFTTTASGQPMDNANSVMPIQFENVPITTAIENLARLSGVNYLLGPKLCCPFLNANGKVIPEPMVTVAWTNLTPKQAFAQLLNEHSLFLVEDPVTSIAEITYTNRIANPVDASLLGSDTNQIVPIAFQDVPLGDALTELAKQANINISLDSRISGGAVQPDNKPIMKPTLSVRWNNVSARQAIVALCEFYGLVIVKDSTTGNIQIKLRD